MSSKSAILLFKEELEVRIQVHREEYEYHKRCIILLRKLTDNPEDSLGKYSEYKNLRRE